MLIFISIIFFISSVSCMPASRIHNGVVTRIENVPYQVQVLSAGFCGGVIISKYWILTAAHCIDQNQELSKSSIITGVSRKYAENGIERKVDKIFVHELYKPNLSYSKGNDIALLKLKIPIKFNKFQKAIRICKNFPKPGDTIKISGYGNNNESYSSDYLKSAEAQMVDLKTCKDHYHYMTENKLCAIGKNNEEACPGDSGGPAIFIDRNKIKSLVGIRSYGFGCRTFEHPGVYTYVCKYKKWINNVVNSN